MSDTLTNEAQIRFNLAKTAQAKGYSATGKTLDMLYQKYIKSAPGTTYLQVIMANTAFLSKNCGCG